MSNDTTFNLRFECPRREDLEEVIKYLELKKTRWDAWQARGKNSTELMERTGAQKPAAVVSWGFDFGEVDEDENEQVSVAATSWANENLRNVYVSGDDGELDDLLVKFPFLDIGGTYESEYGSGKMFGSEKS